MDKKKLIIVSVAVVAVVAIAVAAVFMINNNNTHEQTYEEKVLDLKKSLAYREVEYVYTIHSDNGLRAWDAFAVQYYEDSEELIWRYGTEGKGYMIYTHDITKVVYLDGHTEYWK